MQLPELPNATTQACVIHRRSPEMAREAYERGVQYLFSLYGVIDRKTEVVFPAGMTFITVEYVHSFSLQKEASYVCFPGGELVQAVDEDHGSPAYFCISNMMLGELIQKIQNGEYVLIGDWQP